MRRLAPLALLAAGALSAQAPRPAKSSVVTPTRTAKEFGDHERELAEALKRSDAAAIDRLVMEDFELLAAPHPEEPVAREEWQAAVLASPPASYRISGVSVRLVGQDAALATFSWEQDAKSGNALSGRFTFQDLWVRSGKTWKLQARWAASAADAKVPGWAVQETIEKK